MAASLKGYERYRAFIDSLNEHNVDEYIDLPQESPVVLFHDIVFSI